MNLRPIYAILFAAAPLFSAASSATIAIDAAGNIWQTGTTGFLLTTANAFQKTATSLVCGTENPSPFQGPVPLNCTHAFVTRQDAAGNLLYATYLAGSSQDAGTAVTVDGQGNAYVAGYTYSADFPVTAGAAQSTNRGPFIPLVFTALGAPFGPAIVAAGGDAFVAKFAPDGALLFCTYLGGSGSDIPTLIGVDSAGAVYVAGATLSTDFPVTPNAMTSRPASSFFARLSADGAQLTYATYSGPSILAFDVDAQGRAYLTGSSSPSPAAPAGGPYVTTVDTASGGVAGTVLLPALVPQIAGAGVAIARAQQNLFLAVSPAPAAYNFSAASPPGRSLGASYFLELSADASAVVAETEIGQTQFDSILLDEAGTAYALGHGSGALPPAAIQPLAEPCSPNGGSFVLGANASGGIVADGYFRQGSDTGAAIASPGHVLVYRAAPDALSVPKVVQLDLSAPPAMNFACPQNLASGAAGPGLAPGEIILLTGTGLGPAQGVGAVPNAAGQYPTTLGGVQVTIGPLAAPLLYVQANEIHAVAPFSLVNVPTIQVQFGNQTAVLDAARASDNPGIFSINGQGAVINQDGTVNSPANPAALGSMVSIYCTGTGYLEMPVSDGQSAPLAPLITTEVQPQVTFAGVPGATLWSGSAPTLIYGITQINVQLPGALPAGTELQTVPVVLKTNQDLSPPVSISVKQ